ncbi:MAG TPA: YbjN domain-containing protein [Cellulomonas sp.]
MHIHSTEDHMGFFTKPDATTAPDDLLAPLTRDRIRGLLDHAGLRYMTDEDGELWGWWDQHPLYFLLLGAEQATLSLQGQWNRNVPNDRLGEVLAAANEWAQRHPWPTIWALPGEEHLQVFAHHTVGYPGGVSDERLRAHIGCAIETVLPFFDHLDTLYPEAVAEARIRLGIDETDPGA